MSKCENCPNWKVHPYNGFHQCKGNLCEKEVREDAIRRFAEWLEDNDYLWKIESSYEEQNIDFLSAKTVIDEYEKEEAKKNG